MSAAGSSQRANPPAQAAAHITAAGVVDRDDPRVKARNRRTALLLLAIALLFFFGIIASRFIDSPLVSTGVIGGAVLLYLIVAIGRHLRK